MMTCPFDEQSLRMILDSDNLAWRSSVHSIEESTPGPLPISQVAPPSASLRATCERNFVIGLVM